MRKPAFCICENRGVCVCGGGVKTDHTKGVAIFVCLINQSYKCIEMSNFATY